MLENVSEAEIRLQKENDELRERLRKIAFYATDRRYDFVTDEWNLGFKRAMTIIRAFV